MRLPLGFEPLIDTRDPLALLIDDEEDHSESDVRESETTSRRDSVMARNTLEESGDELRVRRSNTQPGPCITVYRRA